MMVDITERLRLNATDWLFGNTAVAAMKEILKLRNQIVGIESDNTQKPIPLTETQMAELWRLRSTAKELTERIANLESVLWMSLDALKELAPHETVGQHFSNKCSCDAIAKIKEVLGCE